MTETFIGPYRIIRKLSAGGMGTVYEAMHDTIERRVAIKVLHPQHAASAETVRRFFNEAKAANRIDHPGIVQIYDCGQLPDGTSFIVMEFLKGETLGRRLRRFRTRRLLPQNLRLMAQVAEALAAAHGAGIIHRDMKPDNVMVIGDPNSSVGERTKILDFGIAKLRDAGTGGNAVTKDNLLGTPTYMSPEQCRGSSLIDPKTDVYSVGIMLYRMIAARPPFVAEGAGEVLAMHMLQEPPPLQKFAPWLGDELAGLVHKLLAKELTDRPTMLEVAQQLTSFSKALEGFVIPEEHANQAKEVVTVDAQDPAASHSDGDTGALQPTITEGPPPATPSWQSTGSTPSWQSSRSIPSGGLRESGADGEPQRTTQPSMATANGQRQTLTQSTPRAGGLMLAMGVLGAVATAVTLVFWLTGRIATTGHPAQTGPGPQVAPVVAPLRIHWSLTSVPTGAVIRRAVDGVELGRTPWEQDRDAAPGNEVLTVEIPGYVTQQLSLHRDRESERAILLTKLAAAPEPAAGPAGSNPAKAGKGKTGHSAGAAAADDSAGKGSRKPRIKQTDVLED